jgi:TolB-like protein
VAVGFWLIRNQATNERNDLDPKKVVIAVFENRTGDPALDALGTLVSEALAESASGIGDFSVVPSPVSFAQRAVGSESSSDSRALRGLAEETGSGLVVSGSYYLLGDDIRFQAQLTDAASNAVVYSAPAVAGHRGITPEGARRRGVVLP